MNIILIDPTTLGSIAELRVAAINTANTKRDRRQATRKVIALLKSLNLLPSEWKDISSILITTGSDGAGREWFAVVHCPDSTAVEIVE